MCQSFRESRCQLQESGLVRRQMSYDEWLAMSYEGRSEWVDGEALLMPPVTWRDSTANFALMAALNRDLRGVFLYADVGLHVPNHRVRAPDVMAVTSLVTEGFVDDVPVLVVEILSAETRGQDLVAKTAEYLNLGAGQYWMVDPRDRWLDAFTNARDEWDLLLHLDDAHPTGTIAVDDHGDVALDLNVILPA